MTTIIYGLYQFVMTIQGIFQEPLLHPPPQPHLLIHIQPQALHLAQPIEQLPPVQLGRSIRAIKRPQRLISTM